MIDILLATYNSEKFLETQINSILNQSYQDFNIIISDDGSVDKTLVIIDSYIKSYPNKIRLLPAKRNQGAMMNFNYLLQFSQADYIAFADHDDFWLEDKLALSINKIKEIEDSSKSPSLVFTDKSITDENLNITATSSCEAERLYCNDINLNRLLVQNVASGCSIMINKSMREVISSIPVEAVMHDHYIILVAKLLGKVSFINKPLLLYRQHGGNELGAKRYGVRYLVDKYRREGKKLNQRFMSFITQAKRINEIYYSSISDDDKLTLKKFINLENQNAIEFKFTLLKNGFLKKGLLRKVGMLLLLSPDKR